jgi:hypothetical protein
MTPAIKRGLGDHALLIGKRVAAVFVDPIVDLLYVPERDAIVLWTRTFRGRGITRNLYCYSGNGRKRWRVGPGGAGPNGDRYFNVALWSETKLLALTGGSLAVVDFDTGQVLARPPRW